MNFNDIASTGIPYKPMFTAEAIMASLTKARELMYKERGSWQHSMPYGMPLDGLPVRLVEHLEEERRVQVRFPRSKKKRIRKKWRKQSKNYDVSYPPKVYNVPGFGIICNKAGLELLKKRIEEQNNKLINGDSKAKRPEGVVIGRLNK